MTWPVALTNVLNCRFVTGVLSIQKELTCTRCAGGFFRIMRVRSHAESAAGDQNHVVSRACDVRRR